MRRSPTLTPSCAVRALFVAIAFTTPVFLHAAGPPAAAPAQSSASPSNTTRVIIQAIDGNSLSQLGPVIEHAGGKAGRKLGLIHAQAANVPTAALRGLSNHPLIAHISPDSRVAGAMERTGPTIGATAVRQELGFDGSGVVVAVIDSGITPAHDDLTGSNGSQRIDRFVDFVNGATTPYDDYGHGTHVAGIIAGNGFDSGGARSGIAPGAHLVVLKVLDNAGNGRISDVIAALDYVVTHKTDLNIRVVNLSIGAGVYESYTTDPLAAATKQAVSAGIIVIAPSGNAGQDQLGTTAYGGITAPGNAPWVLTVGASSHMGTVDPSDDTIAAFSSRGPTAVDIAAKPDIVAPGVGIESLSAPESALYTTMAPYLLSGTAATSFLPYLSLSGTSMSSPVVAGTVALMAQADPWLTPNQAKAILQFTSRPQADLDAISQDVSSLTANTVTYDALTQGAGFLNAKGAVELAAYFANSSAYPYPDSSSWSKHIIWGNQLLAGGELRLNANAWGRSVTWGSPTTPGGASITWGRTCTISVDGDDTCTTWGVNGGSISAQNAVWGTSCGGANCVGPWTTTTGATLSYTGATATTVVWGSSDADTVVWGSTDGDTVVWGSMCTDVSCQPIIWGKQ